VSTPSIQLHSQDSSSRFLAIGGILFDERYLLDLAQSSNFCKRTPRKIDVCNLTAAICVEALKGSPSYNDLAANIAPPSAAHRDKPSTNSWGQPSQPLSAASSKNASGFAGVYREGGSTPYAASA
jgi:hypothetical protein